ncbi:hypothetical protein H5410_005111 [Solanum commersonii]|uniref:DUF4283 domain-containing protein n=1 Tax=Solanum commersonii TaxID=4109 RepID=A0A9J6A5R1_SOLCO|nr:hypothetical protein H5410_005111 [Solanum commersonii]
MVMSGDGRFPTGVGLQLKTCEFPFLSSTQPLNIPVEVINMTCIEKLQFAIIGKFSYEWTYMEELRRIIPQQCELKRDCQIGLLHS